MQRYSSLQLVTIAGISSEWILSRLVMSACAVGSRIRQAHAGGAFEPEAAAHMGAVAERDRRRVAASHRGAALGF